MKEFDIVALGELLIDFTDSGLSKQGNPLLEANPGGAPCNVLALLSKLGHKTAFIGKVGKDGFGRQLQQALEQTGIQTQGLCFDPDIHTTLAIVLKQENGDRDFSFYRKPGADMMLKKEDIDVSLLENCTIFHFGSLSMTDEPCRTATRYAVETAEKAGALLTFDPNLRESLWSDLEEAREQILYGMAHCQILKIADNEIRWLTGEEDFDRGIAWIQERFDIPLILLSMGADGSRAYTPVLTVEIPAYAVSNVIETTGAGDTFFGGILHFVLQHGWHTYTEQELEDMLLFANAGAAIITTRMGALRVMPEQEEIQRLMTQSNAV